MTIESAHRLRFQERVVDGFFCRIHHSLEQRRKGIFAEQRQRRNAQGAKGNVVCRGKGDGKIAAAITSGRPRPRHSEKGANGQPAQLTRIQGRVGCDDDHAGAVRLISSLRLGIAAQGLGRMQILPDGNPRDRKPASKIRLDKYSDGETSVFFRKMARACSNAGFPPEGDGSFACAHGAFLHRTAPSFA